MTTGTSATRRSPGKASLGTPTIIRKSPLYWMTGCDRKNRSLIRGIDTAIESPLSDC
jgi:hypothetical protein